MSYYHGYPTERTLPMICGIDPEQRAENRVYDWWREHPHVVCTCEGEYNGTDLYAHEPACVFHRGYDLAREIVSFYYRDMPLFVNVYLTDRAYGGPEEGGWYYDCGQIVRVVPVVGIEHARAVAEYLQKLDEYDNSDRHSPSSVISDGHYVIRIEDKPGHDYPTEPQYYE